MADNRNAQYTATERLGAGWTDMRAVFGSNEVTPEGKVKTRVKRMLADFGVYYTMPATGGYGNSGTPDFLVCAWGRFLAIECKSGNNIPTKLQEREMSLIEAAGGKSLVIHEDSFDTLAVTLAAWKGLYGNAE